MVHKTVAILTLGCKVNQYESALLREELERSGFAVVPFTNDADYYIINTCTVTQRSDQKCREYIRVALRKNERAKIIVTGCYAERSPEELRKISSRCVVFGNEEKESIRNYLVNECFSEGAVSLSPARGITHFPNHTRAFVKVQDGCNAFCSYCVVPYVRKQFLSRPKEEILEEITSLANSGYREIVLCGINLGNHPGLISLLEEVSSVENLQRVRISSIEPEHVSNELIRTIKFSSKICHHLHIPLQSGSDRILRLMNRRYTVAGYREIIEMAREEIPDIGISTDLIVGFPGETEEDFWRSYQFVRETGFCKMHIFRFSPRPGTKAYSLPGRVPCSDMKKRSKILINLEKEMREQFYRRYLNKEIVILLEKRVRGKDNCGRTIFSGLSSNYIRVLVSANQEYANRLVPVRITRVKFGVGIGELVQ